MARATACCRACSTWRCCGYLARAGVAFADRRGRRLDFHALRHSFTSLLDQAGCSRATKKRLTRHAGEDVTDGYAHAELEEMAAALSRVAWPKEVPEQAAAAAEICDGKAANRRGHRRDQVGVIPGRNVARTEIGLVRGHAPGGDMPSVREARNFLRKGRGLDATRHAAT